MNCTKEASHLEVPCGVMAKSGGGGGRGLGTDHLPLNHSGQVTEYLREREGEREKGGDGGRGEREREGGCFPICKLESTHLYRVVMKSKCADGYRVNTQH